MTIILAVGATIAAHRIIFELEKRKIFGFSKE